MEPKELKQDGPGPPRNDERGEPRHHIAAEIAEGKRPSSDIAPPEPKEASDDDVQGCD